MNYECISVPYVQQKRETRASDTPLGAFGTLKTGVVEAVVSVVVADHPLLPEAFDACT